jgi:hypothetical protein
MRDLVYLALTVGFFGLAALFVVACDRIVGPDPTDGAVEGGERVPRTQHDLEGVVR